MGFSRLFVTQDPFADDYQSAEDLLSPLAYPSDADRNDMRFAAEERTRQNFADAESNRETIEAQNETPRRPLVVPESGPAIASADPSFRPEPKRAPAPEDDEGGGFDWQRALANFFGGSASVADIDRVRAAQQKLKLDRSKDAREQGKFELERDLLSPAKARKLDAESDKLDAANALNDPKSEQSKAVREIAAQRVAIQIARMNDGPAKDYAKQLLAGLRDPNSAASAITAGKLASQVGADVSDVMRDMKDKFGMGETKRMNDSKIADTEADNAREDKKLAARKAAVAAKVNQVASKVHLTGDQHKLVGEMAEDFMAGQAVDDALPVAEKYAKTASQIPGMGKSGILSGKVQTLKSMSDLTSDPEWNDFKANIQRLFSVERKTFAGTAVTATEMENLRGFIPDFNKDSEATIFDKLKSLRAELDRRQRVRVGQLNYDAKGNPIDPSLISRLLSDVAPDQTAASKQIARLRGNKPAPALPGQTEQPKPAPEKTGAEGVDPERAAKAVRARAALNSPNATPQQKENAAKWLKANGL